MQVGAKRSLYYFIQRVIEYCIILKTFSFFNEHIYRVEFNESMPICRVLIFRDDAINVHLLLLQAICWLHNNFISFFCGFVFFVSHAFLYFFAVFWSPAGKGLISWFAFVEVPLCFVTFLLGVLGQV